jgi:hypothetical protein
MKDEHKKHVEYVESYLSALKKWNHETFDDKIWAAPKRGTSAQDQVNEIRAGHTIKPAVAISELTKKSDKPQRKSGPPTAAQKAHRAVFAAWVKAGKKGTLSDFKKSEPEVKKMDYALKDRRPFDEKEVKQYGIDAVNAYIQEHVKAYIILGEHDKIVYEKIIDLLLKNTSQRVDGDWKNIIPQTRENAERCLNILIKNYKESQKRYEEEQKKAKAHEDYANSPEGKAEEWNEIYEIASEFYDASSEASKLVDDLWGEGGWTHDLTKRKQAFRAGVKKLYPSAKSNEINELIEAVHQWRKNAQSIDVNGNEKKKRTKKKQQEPKTTQGNADNKESIRKF